jgi:HSP20 family molecular chaperone IbpA
VLGEWMLVKDAALKDGLLTIKVEREIPEELKAKTIKIK